MNDRCQVKASFISFLLYILSRQRPTFPYFCKQLQKTLSRSITTHYLPLYYDGFHRFPSHFAFLTHLLRIGSSLLHCHPCQHPHTLTNDHNSLPNRHYHPDGNSSTQPPHLRRRYQHQHHSLRPQPPRPQLPNLLLRPHPPPRIKLLPATIRPPLVEAKSRHTHPNRLSVLQSQRRQHSRPGRLLCAIRILQPFPRASLRPQPHMRARARGGEIQRVLEHGDGEPVPWKGAAEGGYDVCV